VLLVGSRIKSGREFQAIGPATENARRPQVLTVCLCARICGTARPEFNSFLRMLSMTVTRFSSGGVAVCYVLPVLWMTSCLHIMARNRRREKAYRPISSDSPGVSTGQGRSLMSTVTLCSSFTVSLQQPNSVVVCNTACENVATCAYCRANYTSRTRQFTASFLTS